MKRTLPLLALLFAIPAFATQYSFTTIVTSPDGHVTFSVMGISQLPDKDVVAFARMLHVTNKKGGPHITYNNIASTEEVDCVRRLQRSTHRTVYSDEENVPVRDFFNSEWEKVSPGTIDHTILTYVCAYAAGWKDAKG